MSIPTRPGLYVHEDDAARIEQLTSGFFYSFTEADGWWRGDRPASDNEIPDGLIRLVPESAT